MKAVIPLPDDPLWYKEAVIYEARVRAFYDSNGDGIGDFRGLTEKLDYLQDLGITAIWLLPFYPSPLKDDGYDISDYSNVHLDVGTLNDFKRFMREAHQRGIRVITELVLNHSSDQHAWFQRARHAKHGSAHRDFYVWSDTADKYNDARIIFKDYEQSNWAWDPVAGAYYWHRFFSSQPDLNFDNPQVRKTMLRVMEFWLEMGVDGLRLDAVPYLFEREGTNCENLPETHEYLRDVRARVDEKFSNRMLLGEANQWPEDAVAYFGNGDECHMAYHFPIMPRLFMALQMEDRYPILDILNDTPAIPDGSQWALFLRNHDELTLEMVTDEERDYMYRMYAHDANARLNLGIRRRLAPLLGNNRRKIELMNGLLFSLPGTPIIYYGDEIGMGDNFYLGDRNGVRTPMQWSPDRNAGFSRANPQLLYLPVISDPEYHFETINVETQLANPSSLLWWMKRLISLRKRFPAFGRGDIELLTPQNPKVLAFTRSYEGNTLLIVANLSRFTQYVELDLSTYQSMVPRELFGRTRFPPIGELPYLLTLGPHTFYWFALEPSREITVDALSHAQHLPRVETSGDWSTALRGKGRSALEDALSAYLPTTRWFGGKARTMRNVTIDDAIPLPYGEQTAQLAFVRVDYNEGDPDVYLMPITAATGDHADYMRQHVPQAAIAELHLRGTDGSAGTLLYDAVVEPVFCHALLNAMARRRQHRGHAGTAIGTVGRALRKLGDSTGELEAHILSAEQSNTCVQFGDELMLKIFRRVQDGENPDLEISRFLTERCNFPSAPPLAGHITYRSGKRAPMTLALLHGFVPNQGDAWYYTLDELSRFYERVLASGMEEPPSNDGAGTPLELAGKEPPLETDDMIGPYLESVRLLGQRTAELHLALSSDPRDEAFRPEEFTEHYQRSLYQSFLTQTRRTLPLLRKTLPRLEEDAQTQASRILALEPALMSTFKAVDGSKIATTRTRTHGDFHLGQVLFTGKDFVIIDFEGEPARPMGERRIKRSPLRDVAGMLRSFDYAALIRRRELVDPGTPQFATLTRWAHSWQLWVSAAFLHSYLETAGEAAFVPRHEGDTQVLLDAFLLEKALYELGYELNNRPDWAGVPLEGMLRMLEERETTS